MFSLMRSVFCLLILAVAAGFIGCGSKQDATYPVTGKVVFADGRPLSTGGVVRFRWTADKDQSQISASGTIAEDGTYQISTFKKGDGALVGKHEVLIQAKRSADARGNLPASPIAPKFARYETSNLSCNVKPGDNVFDIVVTRP